MGEHSRDVTAVITDNEPPDGTHLVVQKWTGYMTVIWREDRNGRGTDRWFESHDDDPMSLHEHIKNAMAVYALGSKLADFT